MNGVTALLLSIGFVLAQFTIPIPSLPVPPVPIPIPQLPNQIPIPPLLRDTPPLTTAFRDAKNAAPFLDGMSPHTYASLLWAPRNASGDFVLQPGAYELVSQSFCLNAGAHGPSGGETYLSAPLAGSRADVIHTVLAHAADHPELDQSSIQLLLWAITSRAKIADSGDAVKRAATTLLSRRDIDALNGGALGAIPDAVKQRFLAGLPASAQELFAAQEQVRDVLTHGNASYEEIARIAAPPGGPKAVGAPGRWSLMPAGYYLRAVPSGFSTARIQVLVPSPVRVSRDARGRIVSFGTGDRETVGITYDDRGAAAPAAGAKAYAIRAVRVRHLAMYPPLAFQRDRTVTARGWTLVGAPTAGSATGTLPGFTARLGGAERRARAGASGDALDLLSLADALGALPVTDRVWTSELRGTVVDLASAGAAYAACAQRGPCGRQAVLASASVRHSDVAQVPLVVGGAVVLLFGIAFASDTNTQPLGASSRPSGSGGPSGVPPPAGSAPGNNPSRGGAGPLNPSDYPPTDKQRDCAAVASAIQTDRYIQSLYADPGLLARADAQHWSGHDYEQYIELQVAGQSTSPSGANPGPIAGVSPGGATDHLSCATTIGDGAGITMEQYAQRGWPRIVYESVQVHEKVHADLCNARSMSNRYVPQDPREISSEEVAAYQAAIDFLTRWQAQYCGG